MPSLDGLDVVAQPRYLDDDGGVGCPGNIHLRLASADRLDDDQVIARRIQHLDRIGGGPGQATQIAPAGHAADENAPIASQVPHADAVAQDGAAGEGAGRVDGDDAYRHGGGLGRALAEMQGEGVDQRALAAAWRPGDADDVGPSGMGVKGGQGGLGFWAIALDEADGPRYRATPARPEPVRQAARSRDVLADELDDFICGGTGSKNALDAHLVQAWYILVGDDAPGHDQHVVHIVLAQQLHHPGEKGHVGA